MALGSSAHAQVARNEGLGIERFRLSTDRNGILDVDSALVDAPIQVTYGVAMGFAHAPLVVYDTSMNAVTRVVDRRLTTELVGGLTLPQRIEIGVAANLVGYQSGDMSLPSGLGDLRLQAKLQLGEGSRALRLAVLPVLTIPAGSASGYLRESGVEFAPTLVASGALINLRYALDLGYRLKPKVAVAGLVANDEAFARAGLAYKLTYAELFWSASIATPLVDRNANLLAIETLVGGEYAVTRPVGLFAAAGVGLANGFGTPDWRALVGVRVGHTRFNTRPIEPYVATKPPRPVLVVPTPPPPPAKAKLTGTVVSASGQPIAGATVHAGDLELTTDDNGHFETALDGGTVGIGVEAPDYEPGTTSTTLAAGATGNVTVTLQRKVRQGQLRGQVLSFAGKPLSATVTVGDKTVTADADGQYSIDLPAGAFDVTIEATGFAKQTRKINVKLDGVTILNVDLRAGK